MIATGQTATFTVSVAGTGSLRYVLEKDGVAFAGPYDAAFTATAGGEYRVTVYDANQLFTKTRIATLTVNSGESTTMTVRASGATLSGNVTVRASASGATKVEFYLNNVRQFTDSAAPFAWKWNTATAANAPRTLTAKAFNGTTLLGTGAAVNVTVNNAATPPCSDLNEPNNSSLTATPLVFGVAANGYVWTATDADWFRVDVTTPGVLTFNLTVPATNDYDLELFGPNAAYIKGSYRDTGLSEIITHNAAISGTYWVRVYGYPLGNGSHNTTVPFALCGNLQQQPIDSVRFFDSPGSYPTVGSGLLEEFGTIDPGRVVENFSPYYVVDGSEPVTLRFRFKSDGGGYLFNFGFYHYYAPLGTIDTSTSAGKIEYATHALAVGNAISLFDENLDHPGAERTITVNGGEALGFFLLPSATLREFQEGPSNFALNGYGRNGWPLFSSANANPGSVDQLLTFFSSFSITQISTAILAWEDISRVLPSDSDNGR